MNNIKDSIRPFLFYSGLPYAKIAWRKLTGHHRIFILIFHKIDYQTAPFFCLPVNPDIFERQIKYFKKYFNIIDLGALNKIEFNLEYNKDVVVLTFDDGYRDNYTYAFPILKKYKIPATVFLTTDYINTDRLLWYDKLSWILYNTISIPKLFTFVKNDLEPEISKYVIHFFKSDSILKVKILEILAMKLKTFQVKDREDTLSLLAKVCKIERWPNKEERAMLSWDEVREMSEYGISFGSHTKSHPVLSAISPQEVKEEIFDSKRVIEEHIQTPVISFAYPYGKKEDYTDQVTEILKEEGFEYACSTNEGTENLPLKAPLVLKRKGFAPSPYLFF